MKKSALALCVCAVPLLWGCATSMPQPKPAEYASAYDFTLEWLKSDIREPTIFLPRDEPTLSQTDSYRRIDLRWMSKEAVDVQEGDEGKRTSLADGLREVCRRAGGRFEHNDEKTDIRSWCKPIGKDALLFGVSIGCSHESKATLSGKYKAVPVCQLKLVEPLPSVKPTDKAWLAAAEGIGYPSARVLKKQADQRKRMAKVERQVQEDLAKLQKRHDEQILAAGRGTQVCRRQTPDNEYPIYVGYIEDVANGKIQVRVLLLNWKYFNDERFKPQIIWDTPSRWYICQ